MTRSSSGTRRKRAAPSCWATHPASTSLMSEFLARLRWTCSTSLERGSPVMPWGHDGVEECREVVLERQGWQHL